MKQVQRLPLLKQFSTNMKNIVIITQLHDGKKLPFTSLQKYLNAIECDEVVQRALKRKTMPFEYYGMKFERLPLNQLKTK